MDLKILVATHKEYQMPNDNIYFPIQVGAQGKTDLGYQKDNEGDNISERNLRLCELTGIYWAWKNTESDYIGLVHYRRYFTMAGKLERLGRDKFSLILSGMEIDYLLSKYDLILPNKRKYYIESMRSHFIHLPYTYEKDLEILEKTIKKMYPEYSNAYNAVMSRNWAHMFNMFVMKREYFNAYCDWLFSILLEVDKQIDVSNYSSMESRAVAYFGEFMLDIWLENNPMRYKEIDVIFMEKQNWILKGGKFIFRKLRAK